MTIASTSSTVQPGGSRDAAVDDVGFVEPPQPASSATSVTPAARSSAARVRPGGGLGLPRRVAATQPPGRAVEQVADAEPELGEPVVVEHLVDDDRAGDDHLCPLRIEPLDAAPCLEREVRQPIEQL